MKLGVEFCDGSSGGRCTGGGTTGGGSSMLLFDSVLASTDGEDLVWEIMLVVVLVSHSESSVVFDTPSEFVVKGLTVKLGLSVLCVIPLRIYHFTGACFF